MHTHRPDEQAIGSAVMGLEWYVASTQTKQAIRLAAAYGVLTVGPRPASGSVHREPKKLGLGMGKVCRRRPLWGAGRTPANRTPNHLGDLDMGASSARQKLHGVLILGGPTSGAADLAEPSNNRWQPDATCPDCGCVRVVSSLERGSLPYTCDQATRVLAEPHSMLRWQPSVGNCDSDRRYSQALFHRVLTGRAW